MQPVLEAPQAQPEPQAHEPELINTFVAAENGGPEPLALGHEFLADLDAKIDQTKEDCAASTLIDRVRKPYVSLAEKYGKQTGALVKKRLAKEEVK